MSITDSLKNLTKFEWGLWLFSIAVITGSFVVGDEFMILTLVTSIVGVTALIFTAKGDVLGQIIMILFSVLYGIISFQFKYYGEMITYMGMTTPMAVLATISWVRNPYKGKKREVEVAALTEKKIVVMCILTVVVTAVMYYILKYFGNANLIMSTVSITTSFIAAYFTFCRSSLYALGYAFNDAVLIVLWIMASMENSVYIPMILCFIMFLINDLYGLYNWNKMRKRQSMDTEFGSL